MTIYFDSLGNNGHIGNQMFQLASLVGIANAAGLDWKIPPPSEFGKRYPLRSSIYDCFILDDITEHQGRSQSGTTIAERIHSFDKNIIEQVSDGVNLDGYFQSEKYFRSVEDAVRKLFTFKQDIVEKSNRSELPEKYCALHVRRTDYVGNSLHHTNLTKHYYSQALEILSPENVVVFSDDTEWCKQHSLYKNFMVSENNPYCDLYLISSADSHIIANSSFSWWGAYLAKSDRVVAPKQWFGPILEHLNIEDYYLDGWEKI